MSPTIIAGAVALVMAFGAGWKTCAWRAGAAHAAELELQTRDLARRVEHTDVAAVNYETQRSAGQARARVITREIERVVQADPLYRDRCLSDAGLQLIAAAAAGSAPAGGPTPAVPAADATR